MKHIIKQHRKKITKLQKELCDMAEKNLSDGASFKQVSDRLHDCVLFWRTQNPKRNEQTYVSFYDLNDRNKERAIYIRDAGQDATIISIVENNNL